MTQYIFLMLIYLNFHDPTCAWHAALNVDVGVCGTRRVAARNSRGVRAIQNFFLV
jgi:hypothetical protein